MHLHRYICCYCPLTDNEYVTLLGFILNSQGKVHLSQILDLFICAIFEHNLFAEDKEIYYLLLLIINKKFRNQVPVIKPSDNRKKEHYQGLDDCCERDIDSDINRLASGNLC